MTSKKKIPAKPSAPSNKVLQLRAAFQGKKSYILGKNELPSETLKRIKEATNPCDVPCVIRENRRKLRKVKKKVKRKNIKLIAPIKFVINGSTFLQYARSPHHEIIAWRAALLQFAYYAMGASIMPIIWFTYQCILPWQMNSHIFLHTFGFMFVVSWGLMITNPYDSAAFFMDPNYKYKEATVLKLTGFLINITAFVIMVVSYPKHFELQNLSYHSAFGLSAVLLSLLDLPSTLILKVKGTDQMIFAIILFLHTLSFVLASVSYLLALNRKCLVDWYPYKHMGNLCISFGIYYVVNVAYLPLANVFYLKMYNHSFYILEEDDKKIKILKETGVVGHNLAFLRKLRLRHKYKNKPVALPFLLPK